MTELKLNEKYQPSGAGGTRSSPAMPHRLQHLTARFIQNGRRGPEMGPSDQLSLIKFFDSIIPSIDLEKYKMAAWDP